MVGKRVAVQGMGGPLGSCKSREVNMPDGADGYSATVRSHEGRHVTFSPNDSVSNVPRDWLHHPLMYKCVQIAEDCYIETRPLPESTPQSYHNMHRATARKDLADLLDLDPADPETVKANILIGARTHAMFRTYYPDSDRQESADWKAFAKMMPSDHMRGYLDRAVRHAREGNRAAASLMLFRMLGGDESELETQPKEPPKKGKPVSGELGGDGERPIAGKALLDALEGTIGPASSMEIIELPRTVPTRPDKQPVFRVTYPDSGSRLNPARFVSAMVSGEARGLFIQNLTEPKGESTLLIDASGSMHVGADELAEFCKRSPNATVAYYCGTDNATDPRGWLYVYSKAGKRFDGEITIPTTGNTVDLPALKWAAQQRGPITLVSDLGFCGVCHAEIAEAHGLVERLKASGRLTVIESVAKAIRTMDKGQA